MTENLAVPTKYEEDDTPRRFKDLMKPAEKKPTTATGTGKHTPKNKADDVWTVRPGETFRDFNKRIREAGLTVPPGVPETIRVGTQSNQVKRPISREDEDSELSEHEAAQEQHRSKQPKKLTTSSSGSAYPQKRVVEEAMPGEKTKMKKKKYLKERKLASKKTHGYEDEGGRYQKMQHQQQPKFREVVKAPPALRTVPKATLKMRSQKGGPRPSLLPLVKRKK